MIARTFPASLTARMPLLQFFQVTLRYSAEPLLDSVDLLLEPGERVCLLGRNGAGKTSLMRLITGEENPNTGEVIRTPNMQMTRLDQEVSVDFKGTVMEVIRSGLRQNLHEEDWETDIRVDTLAEAMKLPVDMPFSALSGGLKRRVSLARALAGQPDLLLLDEPTNHLDLDSVLWLEDYLLTQSTSLFFVTHDRAFLRKLATRIVDLDRGRLTSWNCDYDTYLTRKAATLDAEEKQWAAFDKKLAQEEAWLRQGVKARRTRNEGRVTALKKLRTERSKRRDRIGTAKIELSEGNVSGQKVIEAKNISFAYDANSPAIIKDFTTTIWRGDKIGIIGPNGGGKTTLLKLLLDRLQPTEGTIKQGTNLQVVYLDQMRDQIEGDKTVAQNVAGPSENVTFQGRSRNIHSYLQDFLFRADRIRMPAKLLSGGERNRLLLARLFLQPANVLVMDEPTNDLDAETLELLEELLVDYSGTLLLVSHDRVFLDNVVTGTLVFEGDGQVGEYIGGYEDWLRQRTLRLTAEATNAAMAAATAPELPAPSATPGIKTEKPRKFLNRERRELGELPALIEKMESEIATLSARLADPAVYQKAAETLPGIHAEIVALEEKNRIAYARWEELDALRKSCETDS
ncbi:MAG: ATP-binding cassette domain-containing protein [Chthoniobacterales bacterium]